VFILALQGVRGFNSCKTESRKKYTIKETKKEK
jgi:hypothetical protein